MCHRCEKKENSTDVSEPAVGPVWPEGVESFIINYIKALVLKESLMFSFVRVRRKAVALGLLQDFVCVVS